MEKYLHYVGKIFAAVGTTDPRINAMGGLKFRLEQQLVSYAQKYPPLLIPPPPSIHTELFDDTSQSGTLIQQSIAYRGVRRVVTPPPPGYKYV